MPSLLHMLLASSIPANRAVYIVAHQDDELLSMGAAILADVSAGRTAYVLLTSRGENSAARTTPALTGPLGRTPTKEEFSAQRDKEFAETVRRLGGIAVIPPYLERGSDGLANTSHIVDLAKRYLPAGSRLRSHALTDVHPDHQKCGQATKALYEEGWGTDPRFYLAAWTRVNQAPPGVTMIKEESGGKALSYHGWAYLTQDIPNGWWGIGYVSTKDIFDQWLADGASWWHPYLPSGITKIWQQSTAPDGVWYRWTGTPHASTSEKYIDGVLVSTNLAPNPKMIPTAGTNIVPRAATVGNALIGVLEGDTNWATFESATDPNGSRFDTLATSPGIFALSVLMKAAAPDAVGQNTSMAIFSHGGTNYLGDPQVATFAIPEQSQEIRLSSSVQATSGRPTLLVWARRGTEPGSHKVMFTRLFIEKVSNLGDHVSQPYFDGDFPDDRQNDLWIDDNGVSHIWDSANKTWSPIN